MHLDAYRKRLMVNAWVLSASYHQLRKTKHLQSEPKKGRKRSQSKYLKTSVSVLGKSGISSQVNQPYGRADVRREIPDFLERVNECRRSQKCLKEATLTLMLLRVGVSDAIHKKTHRRLRKVSSRLPAQINKKGITPRAPHALSLRAR